MVIADHAPNLKGKKGLAEVKQQKREWITKCEGNSAFSKSIRKWRDLNIHKSIPSFRKVRIIFIILRWHYAVAGPST